jgi:hypothetical protein
MKLHNEALQEWASENVGTTGIAVCALVAGVNFALGGMESFKASQAKSAIAGATADLQQKAEDTYANQGCSAQVLSEKSRTNNLVDMDTVIDPMSVTEKNPNGTRFNGGFVCSPDGSIFSVDSTGTARLIGTSPKIRQNLIDKGFVASSQSMVAYANKIYSTVYNRVTPVLPGGDEKFYPPGEAPPPAPPFIPAGGPQQ